MADKRNALEELADFMSQEVYAYWNNGNKPRQEKLKKTQRIISALAKVVDCKEPERIMPLDRPYDDITIYAPYDNGLTESNSINEDEKRFILDLANAAWECREIAEEGAGK